MSKNFNFFNFPLIISNDSNLESECFMSFNSTWCSMKRKMFIFRLISVALLLNTVVFELSAQSTWGEAPVIIKISDAVKPGCLFSINGEGIFGENLSVMMKIATDNSAQLTPPEGSLVPEIIQEDALGQFIVLRFPDNAPAGIYNVWVLNNYGWSKPVTLNGPRALFQSEYEAWPGQSIQVTGRNFDGWEFGSSRNAKVRLVIAGTAYEQVLTDVNPYCVTFTVGFHPEEVYTVEVSNDGGIHWTSPSSNQTLKIVAQGRDDFGLGVAWADVFKYDNVLDVTKNGVPVSSGTDVTAAIQALIDKGASQGGAIVYFPNGTYRISAISLPYNIVLMGQDMYKTQLIYFGTSSTFIRRADNSLAYSGSQGIYQLALRITDPGVRPDRFIWLGFSEEGTPDKWIGSRIFVKKVSIEYPWDTQENAGSGRGLGMTIGGRERILICDNHFLGFRAGLSLAVQKYVQIKNNTIEVAGSGLGCLAHYVFVENNDLEGHREILNKPMQSSGMMLRDNMYAYKNRVNNFGGANDGEGICSETPQGRYNWGKILGATVSSLTIDTTLVWPDWWNYSVLSVQIVGGTGLGQTRTVTSLSGNTITIDKDWEIMPDASSMWMMGFPNNNNTIYKNTITGCGAGYIMYGNWLDGVVADNVSVNSLGVELEANRGEDGLRTGYFNRIARNTIEGESWHVNMTTIVASYAVSTLNRLSLKTTGLYGTEIRENSVSGDPLTIPKSGYTVPKVKSGIGIVDQTGSNGHYGGYWSGSVMISRDQINSIIEKNTIKKQIWGIEITRGNYGVVLCDNRFESIDSSNLWVERKGNVQSVINLTCGEPDSIDFYSIQVEFADSVSGEPAKGKDVVFQGMNYVTNNQGIITLPGIKEGYYPLVLLGGTSEISGNHIIEVRSDSLFRVLLKQLPIYSIQVEFTDSNLKQPIEGMEVVLRGMNYVTNNLGTIAVPELREGYYKLVLQDSRHFEITGNDIIEVRSDSLINVLVTKIPHYSFQVEFIDFKTEEKIKGLEVVLEGVNYLSDSLGHISVTDLREGYYNLVLPDSGFEIAGNDIIEVHSDSLIHVLVSKTANLSLKVINRTTGSPIYRGMASVDSIFYSSNSSGLVSIGKYSLGPCVVLVSHNDYFTMLDTLIFTSDTTITLFMTPKRANVTFQVSDMNGPLSGAGVNMTGFQTTNASGKAFFFLQQARENYAYSVERAGYSQLQDTLYLEVDTTVNIMMELSTSLQEKTMSDYFNIYPNPASGFLMLDIRVSGDNHANVELYNMLGINVYSGQNITFPYLLELESLDPGIYFLKVLFSDVCMTRRIVVK